MSRTILMSTPFYDFGEPDINGMGLGSGITFGNNEYGSSAYGASFDVSAYVTRLIVNVVTSTVAGAVFSLNDSSAARLSVTYGASETGRKTDPTLYLVGANTALEFRGTTDATGGTQAIAMKYAACEIWPSGRLDHQFALSSSGRLGNRPLAQVYYAVISENNAGVTTAEAQVQLRCPVDTSARLRTYITFAQNSSLNNEHILRVDGASTVGTIWAPLSTGLLTSAAQSISAGSLVNSYFIDNGQHNYAAEHVVLKSTTNGWFPLFIHFATVFGTTTAQFFTLQGPLRAATTESHVQYPAAGGMRFKAVWGYVTANSTTGTSTMMLRSGGANTALAISWGAAETGSKANDSDVVTVADGALVNWQFVGGGGGGNKSVTFAGVSYAAQMVSSLAPRVNRPSVYKGRAKIV